MRTLKAGLLIACMPILLSACASSPPLKDVEAQQPPPVSTIGIGDTIKLDRPVQGVSSAVVHSIYGAASGRTCRRLTTAQGQLLAQRSCQRRNGSWYITRQLSAATQLMMPVTDDTETSSAEKAAK